MNAARLQALVEYALNSRAPLARFAEGGVQLTIVAVAEPPLAAAPAAAVSLEGCRAGAPSTISSALYGMFHLQAGAEAPPFVCLGQSVERGQKIGLIEAMKVFSPVVADRAGRIVAVLAEHGAEVECGQPLFAME